MRTVEAGGAAEVRGLLLDSCQMCVLFRSFQVESATKGEPQQIIHKMTNTSQKLNSVLQVSLLLGVENWFGLGLFI